MDTTEVIEGTVLNSLTHEAVGRALVYSPDNRFAVFSDARGHFEFKIPAKQYANPNINPQNPGGSWAPASLMARKPGFLPPRGDVQLSPNQTDVTLYLVPESLIIGHVTIAGSEGSQNIPVQLYRREVQDGVAHWTSAGGVVTRSDGQFRFADLGPGSYKLFSGEELDRDPLTFYPRGPLYGYPPAYFPAAKTFASAGTIQLVAGTTQQLTLSPSRRPYYPVELNVTNVPMGGPVELSVFLAGQPGPGYSLGYDPSEQKIQGSLPDGTYAVEISSFGPSSATGTVSITVGGAAVRGQTVSLAPNSPIRVNVTEEFTSAQNGTTQGPVGAFIDGPAADPAAAARRPRYVQMWLQSADDFNPRQGGSLREAGEANGESLLIDNIQPGRYWVRTSSSRGYVATANCGGVDVLRHPLVVPPGGSPQPIEVTLRDDGADLDGTVEGAGDQQVVQIYFLPVSDGIGQFREITGYAGKFLVNQVPPGDYRVLAFDGPQQLEYRNEEAMHKLDSSGQFVRLVPGQKQHVTLHFVPASE